MKRNILYIGLFCIFIGVGCLLLVHLHDIRVSDRINTVNVTTPAVITPGVGTSTATTTEVDGISYEIVTSQADQQKGLSGRSNVPDNYGMLFVFPADGKYGFWMIDMLVSLDMIWLSDSGTIVAINDSVSPATYPNVFYPPNPVRYVLETKAGFAREKNWKIGTKISLPLPYGK